MAKYKEAMDRIQMTEEMQSRILGHVEKHFARKRRNQKLKIWIPAAGVLAAAAVLLILLQPWKTRETVTDPVQTTETPVTTEQDYLPQGTYQLTTYDSVKELSEAVGYDIKEPTSFPGEVTERNYQDINHEIAEINYGGSFGTISYRVSKGTKDNSGVYEAFKEDKKVEIEGISVTLKGETDKYALVIWTDGTCSYSMYCIPGISEANAKTLANEIIK